MHLGDVFNAKLLRSVHGYPRIGLCKRNYLDAGTTRLFVPALTSTERIWRHIRHVRFGSGTDIPLKAADIRFTLESGLAGKALPADKKGGIHAQQSTQNECTTLGQLGLTIRGQK